MNITNFVIITNKLKEFLTNNDCDTFTKFNFRYSINYSEAVRNTFAIKVKEYKDIEEILKYLKCENAEVLGNNYYFSKEVYLLIEVQH